MSIGRAVPVPFLSPTPVSSLKPFWQVFTNTAAALVFVNNLCSFSCLDTQDTHTMSDARSHTHILVAKQFSFSSTYKVLEFDRGESTYGENRIGESIRKPSCTYKINISSVKLAMTGTGRGRRSRCHGPIHYRCEPDFVAITSPGHLALDNSITRFGFSGFEA